MFRTSYMKNTLCNTIEYIHIHRDHFVYAPSQWETMLQCNVVCHWLSTYAKWSLYTYVFHLLDSRSVWYKRDKVIQKDTVYIDMLCRLLLLYLVAFLPRSAVNGPVLLYVCAVNTAGLQMSLSLSVWWTDEFSWKQDICGISYFSMSALRFYEVLPAIFSMASHQGIFVGLILMLWHRETHINPQRNRKIIVDPSGIELTTSRLRNM